MSSAFMNLDFSHTVSQLYQDQWKVDLSSISAMSWKFSSKLKDEDLNSLRHQKTLIFLSPLSV